jgi:hypothetical protein
MPPKETTRREIINYQPSLIQNKPIVRNAVSLIKVGRRNALIG